MLYDVHCHLHAEVFDVDRDLVIERARARGVRRVLAVAEDLEDAYRLLAVADRHPDFIVPAIGVHPDRAPRIGDAEVDAVLRLLRAEASRLGAVGEVGLDHRPLWSERDRARQAEVFELFIRAGRELGLPLSVHSRGAGRAALEVLARAGAPPAGLHAFDGRPVYAEAGFKAGHRFSIPPSIVLSGGKRKLAARLPLEALLLESDSPVLGPEAGVRNEPANLGRALEVIAELKAVPLEELVPRLAGSTEALFPRLVRPKPGRNPAG